MGEIYNTHLLEADNMVNMIVQKFREVDSNNERSLDIKQLEKLIKSLNINVSDKNIDVIFQVYFL